MKVPAPAGKTSSWTGGVVFLTEGRHLRRRHERVRSTTDGEPHELRALGCAGELRVDRHRASEDSGVEKGACLSQRLRRRSLVAADADQPGHQATRGLDDNREGVSVASARERDRGDERSRR